MVQWLAEERGRAPSFYLVAAMKTDSLNLTHTTPSAGPARLPGSTQPLARVTQE